jgi:glycine/D-amino acid oxidase-like deaminating enzyme
LEKRVIVIGAGIIGASIAWHLAKAGAKVSVLDGAEPGGLATRYSWAWINASWGNPQPYFRLRERSMQEWRQLDREVSGLSLNWCGGLIWDLEPGALDAYAREQASWGYGIQRVSGGEIQRLEPNLRAVPDYAYHVTGEGMIEPVAATRAMLASAAALGVEILAHTRVTRLLESNGRVVGVVTEEGPIHAIETVVAAGAGAVELLESAGIVLKVKAPPGLLAHSKPAPQLLRGLVMTPGLHVRQTAEGRFVAGTDFAGGDPMDRADEMARDLHAKTQALVRGAEGVELDFHTTGYRPTPADGFPAIGRPGRREGLYVAVTHSGVTLAPVIGLFVARELLGGQRDPLLAPYHPDRIELT